MKPNGLMNVWQPMHGWTDVMLSTRWRSVELGVIGSIVLTPGGGLPSGRHMILRVKNTPRLTRRVVVGPECDAITAGCVKMPMRCAASSSTGVAAEAGALVPYRNAVSGEAKALVDCVISFSAGAALDNSRCR